MYGKAMAFKELYTILESADITAQNLAQQIKNPQKDYALGT